MTPRWLTSPWRQAKNFRLARPSSSRVDKLPFVHALFVVVHQLDQRVGGREASPLRLSSTASRNSLYVQSERYEA